MNAPEVGQVGRTITRLDPFGQVEVGGVTFQAETTLFGTEPLRAPIPPDRAVVVSGWRADSQNGVILLVTDPAAESSDPGTSNLSQPQEPALLPDPLSSPEERLRALEQKLQGSMRKLDWQAERSYPSLPAEPAGGVGLLLLTFGQIVSVLGCIALPVWALVALARASAVRSRIQAEPDPSLWIVFYAVVAFLYSAAMYVVFSRVKRIPPE